MTQSSFERVGSSEITEFYNRTSTVETSALPSLFFFRYFCRKEISQSLIKVLQSTPVPSTKLLTGTVIIDTVDKSSIFVNSLAINSEKFHGLTVFPIYLSLWIWDITLPATPTNSEEQRILSI